MEVSRVVMCGTGLGVAVETDLLEIRKNVMYNVYLKVTKTK